MIDRSELVSRFVAAQLAGDREAALSLVLEPCRRGELRVVDAQAQIIAAAQAEIGHLWLANRVTVAQEHLATGIAQIVLTRLVELARPAKRNGAIVAVACVEGEHHELPSRLVADYLEQAGYTVRYYGANLPTHDLVDTIARERPDALALSVTMTFNVPALRDAVAALRARLPNLPILVGGRAIAWSPALPGDLGVATAPADPEALVLAFDALIGGRKEVA